ncbi:MAG TPA: DUF1465 family protein [Sphingomonas sp.]|jgi:regulator of CtrA degradation|uniref:DUF1465 family protein n=1 Tax=Sphingomonas sp. TaxID=28214 RepID=UPI002EDB0F99
MTDDDHYGLTERLVDALHTEALLMADEARAYFDEQGRVERDRLAPAERVLFACESLKVTTRLMHVIAWLLSRRAYRTQPDAVQPPRPVADPIASSPEDVAALPPVAQQLISASRDLHERVRRLETDILRGTNEGSPARLLMGRLERAL